MQESYLEACLEAGFKTIKNRRLNAVGKCPEYTLMDKPWKELVKLAVLETEIPGQDEDGETIAPSPRFRRGRRRGRQQSTIPSPTDIQSMTEETPALRFALLLVNKFLHAEQWEEGDYASLETELREACLAQGVHSVWHEMAKRSDLLVNFLHALSQKLNRVQRRRHSTIRNCHRSIRCNVVSRRVQIDSRRTVQC